MREAEIILAAPLCHSDGGGDLSWLHWRTGHEPWRRHGRARLATTSATTCSSSRFQNGSANFLRHTHRLVASGVGFDHHSRGVALDQRRALLASLARVLGLAAVILQACLVGEITWMKDELGNFFIATLAQMFLVLVCSLPFFPPAVDRRSRAVGIQQNFRCCVDFPSRQRR